MAIATGLSIGTSNKVSVDYQSQEVSVSVTYELERHDTDLLAFVADKAAEVEQAHTAVWRRIREIRADQRVTEDATPAPPSTSAIAATTTEAPQNAPDAPQAVVASPRASRGGRSRRSGSNGHGEPERPEDLGDSPFGLPPTAAAGPAGAPSALSTAEGIGSDSSTRGSSHGSDNGVKATDPASPAQLRAIYFLSRRADVSDRAITEQIQSRFAKGALDQLTRYEAGQLLLDMQRADRGKSQPTRVGPTEQRRQVA